MKIKKVSGTAILNGNVVDSLEDNSSTNAPSQRAVKEYVAKASGGTADYVYLDNKPTINGVTLSGNLTTSQLKLQPAGDYATTNYVTEQISNAIGSALGGSY